VRAGPEWEVWWLCSLRMRFTSPDWIRSAKTPPSRLFFFSRIFYLFRFSQVVVFTSWAAFLTASFHFVHQEGTTVTREPLASDSDHRAMTFFLKPQYLFLPCRRFLFLYESTTGVARHLPFFSHFFRLFGPKLPNR